MFSLCEQQKMCHVSCIAGAQCQQVVGGNTEKNRGLLFHWILLQS